MDEHMLRFMNKTYSSFRNVSLSRASSREAARGARICETGLLCFIIKTHVRGFFDTDLHEVSWHFATHEVLRPRGF